MAKNMDERFAHEKIPRLILSLAAPAIAAQAINALYNLVDRMYISRIPVTGTAALTGVGLTFPIIMAVSAFAALVGFGGAPLASISMGEGNKEKAEKLLGNCFAALTALAVVLTAVLLPLRAPLLRLFGASPDTLPFAVDYLGIYLCGTISVQIALGMNQFISAQGFAKTAMITVCVGAALNIVLDPLFIFTFGMGVQGAALATILSQTVSALWVLHFLLSSRTNLRLQAKNMRIQPKLLLSAVALGFSPFIMQSTESLIQIAFNASLAHYGDDLYVGTMVIMASSMQFILMPLQGLTQGASPIIGYNYGSGDYRRVKTTIKYVTAFSVGFGVLVWALCVFLPEIPTRIFSDDEAIIGLAKQLMPVYYMGIIIFGFQMSFQQAFVALGQAKVSVFVAVFRKIILLIPLILILPLFVRPQTFGIILAEPISDTLSALTCCVLFAMKYRQLLSSPPDKTRLSGENP